MAKLLHPSLVESTISQLDLFLVSPSQTSLEEENFSKYHSVPVLICTGSVDFIISAENSNYIDFQNSFLSQTLFGNPKGPVELNNPNTCAETKLCLNFILFRIKK